MELLFSRLDEGRWRVELAQPPDVAYRCASPRRERGGVLTIPGVIVLVRNGTVVLDGMILVPHGAAVVCATKRITRRRKVGTKRSKLEDCADVNPPPAYTHSPPAGSEAHLNATYIGAELNQDSDLRGLFFLFLFHVNICRVVGFLSCLIIVSEICMLHRVVRLLNQLARLTDGQLVVA